MVRRTTEASVANYRPLYGLTSYVNKNRNKLSHKKVTSPSRYCKIKVTVWHCVNLMGPVPL